MTVSVCVTVNDGMVLAADSATTMQLNNGDKQVYNHADKIFNLFKGLPIGAATWGLGSLGRASMATLSKDFRRLLTEHSAPNDDDVIAPWGICTRRYSVRDVAEKFKAFLQDHVDPMLGAFAEANELRRREAVEKGKNPDEIEELKPEGFTFRIAGYSDPSDDGAEIYQLTFDGTSFSEPERETSTICWGGQGTAIERLLLGIDGALVSAISEIHQLDRQTSFARARSYLPHTEKNLVNSAMPIIDAIDLARFLVSTTVQYYRFLPGAQIVGGPIEIATITRHEGFKWIERKHFFDRHLNLN